MINILKDLDPKTDNNKHEQVGLIKRGINVIKEQSQIQMLEMKNETTEMKNSSHNLIRGLGIAEEKKIVNQCP